MTQASTTYEQAYAAWQRDPEAWWAETAEGITWDKRWDKVFDPSRGPYGQWFAGGTLNTCYNCLDRHVAAGRGDAAGADLGQPDDRADRALHLRRTAAAAAREVRRRAGAARAWGAATGW